jgi:PKD repeat protein
MRKVGLLVLSMAFFGFVGCSDNGNNKPKNEEPNAAFSVKNDGCTAECAIEFVNNSENANSFKWSFGDGGTSTKRNPTHTYQEGGVYTVRLEAKGDNTSSTATKKVNISAPNLPEPSFTINGDNCHAPCQVSFNNTSSDANSFEWRFDDGETSQKSNPDHVYQKGGTYNVTLIASNKDGEQKVSKEVNIDNAYSTAFIQKIEVTSLSFTAPGGGGWDPSSGPDLFVDIDNADGEDIISTEGNGFDNLTQSDLPVSWTFQGQGFEINNLSRDFFVDVWDNDSFGDDNITAVPFTLDQLTDYPNSYPKTVEFQNSDATVKLYLNWEE